MLGETALTMVARNVLLALFSIPGVPSFRFSMATPACSLQSNSTFPFFNVNYQSMRQDRRHASNTLMSMKNFPSRHITMEKSIVPSSEYTKWVSSLRRSCLMQSFHLSKDKRRATSHNGITHKGKRQTTTEGTNGFTLRTCQMTIGQTGYHGCQGRDREDEKASNRCSCNWKSVSWHRTHFSYITYGNFFARDLRPGNSALGSYRTNHRNEESNKIIYIKNKTS